MEYEDIQVGKLYVLASRENNFVHYVEGAMMYGGDGGECYFAEVESNNEHKPIGLVLEIMPDDHDFASHEARVMVGKMIFYLSMPGRYWGNLSFVKRATPNDQVTF